MRNRFWRRNKSRIIFGTLIVGSLALNHKGIARNMTNMENMRIELERQANYQTMLEMSEDNLAEQAKIADARLSRGCIPVVDPNSKKVGEFTYFNLVPLQKAAPVRDRTNKSYLVAGTCVVGANGETAILRENQEGTPVALDIAAGGSKELVDKNIRRIAGSKARVYWNTPIKEQ
ncbi:MAG: hypothetical protein KME29_04975 [Calothrix sp. FI2-JRJ7]|jgi:hypothetical protein|nr:hypothetical protein [Calothrix sp. FI2-JRJ7]